MSKKELIAALKEAWLVYAWVRLTEHDGAYMRLYSGKESLYEEIMNDAADTIYDARLVTEDGADRPNLYIG